MVTSHSMESRSHSFAWDGYLTQHLKVLCEIGISRFRHNRCDELTNVSAREGWPGVRWEDSHSSLVSLARGGGADRGGGGGDRGDEAEARGCWFSPAGLDDFVACFAAAVAFDAALPMANDGERATFGSN